jgi:hypothetical protein
MISVFFGFVTFLNVFVSSQIGSLTCEHLRLIEIMSVELREKDMKIAILGMSTSSANNNDQDLTPNLVNFGSLIVIYLL